GPGHAGQFIKEETKKVREKINEFLRDLRGKKYTKKVQAAIDKFVKGLGVLGIERNTTRRADNQLRGRAGRQGDSGESQFFVSLEDEMLKNFGVKEQVGKFFNQKQLKELFHKPLSGKIFNYLISEPQETLRNVHASNRQYHLNYDLLINRQRQFIYNYRDKLLKTDDLTKIIKKKSSAKKGEIVPIEQEYLKAHFVRIKDSEIATENNLAKIREHLKKPYRGVVRFHEKTSEQIVKERYDKVLEEVDFDYEKFHDWIYDEKNKERIEIVPRKMETGQIIYPSAYVDKEYSKLIDDNRKLMYTNGVKTRGKAYLIDKPDE
ncbi:15938_t:CDS:2, partial [Cetraspora pellucida]